MRAVASTHGPRRRLRGLLLFELTIQALPTLGLLKESRSSPASGADTPLFRLGIGCLGELPVSLFAAMDSKGADVNDVAVLPCLVPSEIFVEG